MLRGLRSLEGAVISSGQFDNLPGVIQTYRRILAPALQEGMEHYGVVSAVDEHGVPTRVIDYDGQGVLAEKDIKDFKAEGWSVVAHAPSPAASVGRAQHALRQYNNDRTWRGSYHFLFNNCQTFAMYCCYGTRWSLQIEMGLAYLGVIVTDLVVIMTLALLVLGVLTCAVWVAHHVLSAASGLLVAVLLESRKAAAAALGDLAHVASSVFCGSGSSVLAFSKFLGLRSWTGVLGILGSAFHGLVLMLAGCLSAVGIGLSVLVHTLRFGMALILGALHAAMWVVALLVTESGGSLVLLMRIVLWLLNGVIRVMVLSYFALRSVVIFDRVTGGDERVRQLVRLPGR